MFMTNAVFATVLGAAVLHASWNAIAKSIPDQLVAAGLLTVVGAVVGGVGVVVLPLPATASWPYAAASAALQAVYLLLLVHAYRHGEFGQVYPLARGLPPLLVAGVSVGLLGEQLTGLQLAGVGVVSLALTALVFSGGRPRAGSGLGLAAATGVTIAAYTLVDGLGVRESGNPLSYIACLFLLHGTLTLVASRTMYGPGFGRAMTRWAGPGLLGGLLAMVAYGTVVWAQSQASLALVSAVRETSLLFAAVIGTLMFGERFRAMRLAAVVVTIAGLVMVNI